MPKGEKIDKLLYGGYSTISLGYIGIYEMTKLMKGVPHTSPEGHDFAIKVMKKLKESVNKWRKQTNIGFALYGTPSKRLCYRFAEIDKEKFGSIPDVTDKGYYTNSYQVNQKEEMGTIERLSFESEFQGISTGGAMSYIKICNEKDNPEELENIIRFIYDNVQYVGFKREEK